MVYSRVRAAIRAINIDIKKAAHRPMSAERASLYSSRPSGAAGASHESRVFHVQLLKRRIEHGTLAAGARGC